MAPSFSGVARDNLSVAKPNNARGVFKQPLVMSGENEGEPEAAIQVAHQVNQQRGVMSVEVGSWLVG
jgi:hypothetical protein